MWQFWLLLTIVSCSGEAIAFPQNDGLAGNNVEIQTTRETFVVDGFVFDGPANRPGGSTTRIDSATVTTIATTTAAPNDSQYNQCVTRCPATPEYNPVCGSDNVEYDNPGRLNCASACGRDVTLKYVGRCMTSKIRGR
ncbi:hypothetical protein E2986_04974 [Frieseomelitta varia]|uniref:Kazal-like domain-containing protein n=1 Tax=Frieseomelitta varia TaxID=561572 RepID=A0A833WA92_9HYME|nr:uncharacterized protein LOC122533999 [Frieseomelitta varia]KAF3429747.1 hypothetical protein E2986_04974 [Frieseomelitta varia]